MNRECKTVLPKASPERRFEPAPSSPPDQTSPSTSIGSSESTSSTTDTSAPPLGLSQILLSDLPSIPQVGKVYTSTDRSLFDYSAYVLGVNNKYVVVSPGSDSDTLPFQASSEGWKIIGVAWYWWAVMIGGAVGLYYLVRFLINKFPFGVAKTS